MKRFMHARIIVVSIEKNLLMQLNVMNVVNQGGKTSRIQMKGESKFPLK